MDRIGIIFGGKSHEHEISLLSAAAVLGAIDREKHEIVCIGIDRDGKWYRFDGDENEIPAGTWQEHARPVTINEALGGIDFAFPIIHGTYGEDGRLQGVFEMMDLPYAGCGVLASALCMDKALSKEIFFQAGIPNSKYTTLRRDDLEKGPDYCGSKCEEALDYPMFVKPANTGSSIGISKVRDRQELWTALELAAKYDPRIVIEEGIDAREVECAVIGNGIPQVTGVGEIIARKDFYDYEAKYSDDAGTEIVIPARNINRSKLKEIQELAKKAYLATNCEGFARADFLIEKGSGRVFLNEINTIPGCTKYSMFPVLWHVAGVPFTELIERIIGFGYERYNA